MRVTTHRFDQAERLGISNDADEHPLADVGVDPELVRPDVNLPVELAVLGAVARKRISRQHEGEREPRPKTGTVPATVAPGLAAWLPMSRSS